MPRSRIGERLPAAERVADHGDWYLQDRNPLRAWLAYRDCRRYRLPIPEWVLDYFDRVSDALASCNRKPPKDPAPAILRALEMRRARGTGSTALKAADRNFAVT